MSDITIEHEAFLNRLGDELGIDGTELVFGVDDETRAIYTASILEKYDNHSLQDDNELPIGTLALALSELRGEERTSARDRGARKVDKWMHKGSIASLINKYYDKISSDEMALRRSFVYSGLEKAPEILTTDSGVQVVELTTHEDMVKESDFQDSCIGRGRTYSESLLRGEGRFFSLRHSDGTRFTMEVDIRRKRLALLAGMKNVQLNLARHDNARDFLKAIGETLMLVEEDLEGELEFPPYTVAKMGTRHFLLTKNGSLLLPDRKGFTPDQIEEAAMYGVRSSRLSIKRLLDGRLRTAVFDSQNVDIEVTGMTTQDEINEVLAPGTELKGTLKMKSLQPVILPNYLRVYDLIAVGSHGLAEWRNDTRISGRALVDADDLMRIEGVEGVTGRIVFRHMRDGLLPEDLETTGDLEINGKDVTRLPQAIKARKIRLNTPNAGSLGVTVCDELDISQIVDLDGIDSGSQIGTLNISPTTMLRWLESEKPIPPVFNELHLTYSNKINKIVSLLLKRAGITCDVEPSV